MGAVIDVDANGVDKAGNDYHLHAYKDKVSAGLMVNWPVLIRYPDGRIAEGNKVMITQKGLDMLRREIPVGDREPEGTA